VTSMLLGARRRGAPKLPRDIRVGPNEGGGGLGPGHPKEMFIQSFYPIPGIIRLVDSNFGAFSEKFRGVFRRNFGRFSEKFRAFFGDKPPRSESKNRINSRNLGAKIF